MTETGSPDVIDVIDVIDLAVPLKAEYAATIRVVVASVGADLEFTIDEIDDLRLGVSEVFTLLTDSHEATAATTCYARFELQRDAVSVTMSRGLDGDVIELDPLASTILSSVVDQHRVTPQGITLRKRATETASSIHDATNG